MWLWKASWCFRADDDPAAEDWVAEHAPALLHGRSAETAAPIARQTDGLGLTTERRGGVKECVRYLANKEPYLGCAQALEQGWPIATGVVEGAKALVLHRAVIIDGDFEEYWPHHIEQEHLRTRQGRHQD